MFTRYYLAFVCLGYITIIYTVTEMSFSSDVNFVTCSTGSCQITTSGAASDKKIIKMTTILFQCEETVTSVSGISQIMQ